MKKRATKMTSEAADTGNAPVISEWGRLVKEQLKKFRPKMYRNLLHDGELDAFAIEMQEAAKQQVCNSMSQGVDAKEAQNMALEQWIYLPPEAARA